MDPLAQSLGLSNDSVRFSDSIFYANGSDGGKASTLSALDRQLVEFFYAHVTPGDGKAELHSAIETHWPRP